MADVYVKNPRFTQTFDPLQFKEIALNDGVNPPLNLKVYEPFKLDLHPTVDNSHSYDVDFTVKHLSSPEDKTSEVIPLPVMDNTSDVAEYMLDRVDYDVLLNKTNIDRLDNVKDLPR
jgi:hypothetical protein